MRPTKSIVLLLAVLLFTMKGKAQVSRIYTTQDGLTTSSIYSTYIDSKGIAWITGVASLNMFDGNKFYDILESHNDMLINAVRMIKEYRNNTYWLATSNGLLKYNLEDNSIQHMILRGNEPKAGFSVNNIIDYIKADQILLSTDGNGIIIFDEQEGKTDSLATAKLQKIIPQKFCTTVFIDKSNNLWVVSIQHQLIVVNLNTMKEIRVEASPEALDIIRSSNVNTIVQERKSNDILFGTNAGVLIYDAKLKQLRTLKQQFNFPVSSIIERKDGAILFGTDSRGIWQFGGADETLIPYAISSPNVNLDFAKIRSFSEDANGNLLIGIYQKGVLVLPNNSDNFIYHAVSPAPNGINVSSVTSIAADKEGTYWIGTDGCGVFKAIDGDINHVLEVDGLKSGLVQCIAIDNRGTVWAGSYGGGLQCCVDERFVTPEWLSRLSNGLIMDLAYDKDSDILFVGTNGRGVYRINLKDRSVTNLSTIYSFNGWTYSLYYDNMGNLWIGTAKGVFQYNIESNSINEVVYEQSDVLMAKSIMRDGDKLLIGTNSGLVIYDINNKTYDIILPKESIMSVEATTTDIWLAAANSIIRLDKATLTPHVFSSFGGYFIGEFHPKAQYKSPSDFIFFGSDNGIISFDSKLIAQQKKFAGQLMLTGLKVNGQTISYDAGSDDNILDRNIFSATKISLGADENSLTFTFGVPDFASPNRIFYEYILEGYDNAWHTIQSATEGYYSALPSGTYTLRIRAYYENDKENAIEKSIKVVVAYPWYASWWAWIIYILIFASILYYIYNVYQQRQRQKRLLGMARQNEQMKEAKLRMFTSITHELRSPLTMIVSPLRQLMSAEESTGEMSKESENRISLYRLMERNCERLLNIVKQITDIRKIDSGQFHLHFSKVDFLQYSDSIAQSFAGYATTKRITFTIEHANQHVSIWLDKVHFEKILVNLLSNAFKFTPEGGKILIRTHCILKNSKDWFEIRVYNSGSYIAPRDLPHIFERFYQANNGTSDKAGSGIGLNLVTELVNLHHGTINVRNVDPDGVEFVMEFPLGNSHLTEEELLPREEETKQSEDDNSLFADIEVPDNEEEDEDDANTERKKRTIMVVDDDKALCQYIKDQLQDTYNVIVAYGGNPAWQQILKLRPDAVVTDIRMPDGDGIELCKRIKSNPETNNIPVIMLTSENSDRAQIQSLNLDVDHFLSKPFNLLMLKGAIAQGIRIREQMVSRIHRTEIGFDYSAAKIDSVEDILFGKVNEALRKHLDDSSFGVRELASEIGVSRVHLNRKMKERYGMSPNSFIRSYRLKQAAYFLVNNDVNISEVAYRVGFSSHSHFSNTFREYFGMTPKEFIAYYSENMDDETLQKLLE